MKFLAVWACVLVLCPVVLLSGEDMTRAAADEMIVIFDKATAGIVDVSKEMAMATTAQAVAAALDRTTAVLGTMMDDIKVFSEKHKNSTGNETEALRLIEGAKNRFLKAQAEFQATLGRIRAEILATEEVRDALKRLQALNNR